jgi:hypothetical protein
MTRIGKGSEHRDIGTSERKKLTAETRRRGEELEIGHLGIGIWKSKTLPLIYTDNTDREEIAEIVESARDRRDTKGWGVSRVA